MTAALQLIERPDTTELSTESSVMLVEAKAFEISDDATYNRACVQMNLCADLRKEIVSKFTEPKKRAHEAHAALCKWEKDELTPVDAAEREWKRKISNYRAEQERIRLEEQRRLEAEAKKREEDRLLAEALEAENDGDAAAAEEIISAPVLPPPARLAPAVPKTAGVTFRETWSARVVNPMALIRYVAAHPECVNYLTPNITALNQVARAQKSAARIDGVVIEKESNVAAGGRR